MRTLETRCCIAGGGPAGMMLGLLLARAGVDVVALEIRADLIVGADGRDSTVRAAARLPVKTLGAPMDVLWFRLPKRAGVTSGVLGRIEAGRIFVMLDRGDYWQCGFVIAKGTLEDIRARGLEAFRADVARLVGAPVESGVLRDWNEVKLLTVRVDHLTTWFRPGLLCIGDAAHAMSPVGGVGINLAIQDAVAAANVLAAPLRARGVGLDDLARVQRRRAWPTRVTQGIQVLVQNRVVRRVLESRRPVRPALAVRLLGRYPRLRRLPGRLVGLGVRPERLRV